jgi:predicted transcriptional regulator
MVNWPMNERGLWDAAQGAFYGSILHQSIVARGWTIKDFARASRLDPGSVYHAIHGGRVRDATAIRIFQTLERRPPMTIVWE